MKTKVKELLQEFIDRDFTVSDMTDVISALNDIEYDNKVFINFNKIGDESNAEFWSRQKEKDKEVLAEIMEDYSLKYQIDDLVS